MLQSSTISIVSGYLEEPSRYILLLFCHLSVKISEVLLEQMVKLDFSSSVRNQPAAVRQEGGHRPWGPRGPPRGSSPVLPLRPVCPWALTRGVGRARFVTRVPVSRPLLGPGARGRGPSESLLVCEMREPIAALRVCEDWREIT